MTSHLEKEIGEVKEQLLAMAAGSEAAAARAVRAVVDRDNELARGVIESDAVIDRLEMEIDERVINLLTKALLATDLRLMTVAMKVARDLERVADEATTIARRALLLNRESETGLAPEIPQMAGLALGMLKESLDTFVNRQPERARALISRDLDVDALNKQIHRNLTSQMLKQVESIGACLNFMVVSRSLEHIADLAKSVAEEVVYLYEAEDIRHTAGNSR